MRRLLASCFAFAACAGAALPLAGCDFNVTDDLAALNDEISCGLSVGFANGRPMEGGRGTVYGAPLAPVPDVLARGSVEDLVFSLETHTGTEHTILEPKLAVEGDALVATSQSLSCTTSNAALLDGRITARSSGTAKIVVTAVDGSRDAISFEVREAASLSINGPDNAAVGEELYVAAELRDADDLPLYASSSVTWTVLEGGAVLPEADEGGALHGAFARVEIASAGHAVLRADAVGFSATIEIEATDASAD